MRRHLLHAQLGRVVVELGEIDPALGLWFGGTELGQPGLCVVFVHVLYLQRAAADVRAQLASASSPCSRGVASRRKSCTLVLYILHVVTILLAQRHQSKVNNGFRSR